MTVGAEIEEATIAGGSGRGVDRHRGVRKVAAAEGARRKGGSAAGVPRVRTQQRKEGAGRNDNTANQTHGKQLTGDNKRQLTFLKPRPPRPCPHATASIAMGAMAGGA